MKLCFIIAEFNPLTNGHAYIIEKAKEESGLDVGCIMSGNIVERGELAILEKHERAALALNVGASIVLELPTIYASSSATNFAAGAIKILKRLPVSHLAFGVEIENKNSLLEIAHLRASESDELKNALKKHLKKGENYSVSLFEALCEVYPEKKDEIVQVFLSANNILAVEYLVAIIKQKANITPIFIDRQDNGHSSSKPKVQNNISFLPASKVRELIKTNIESAKDFAPACTFEAIKRLNSSKLSVSSERLDALLISKLREKSKESLVEFQDFTSPIANSLFLKANKFSSIQEILDDSRSKNIRENRIRRLLFYPYLDLTKKKYDLIDKSLDSVVVLGVKKEFKPKLKELAENSKLTLIISQKDKLNLKKASVLSLEIDKKASELYSLATKSQTTNNAIFE